MAGPELVGPRGAPVPVPGAAGPGAGRIGALDGLRALALLGVLAYHVAPSAVPGGFLGVESFFVLSGFLLASLLIGEQRREGHVDLRAYAGRRLRRIAPALVTLLATLVVLGPVLAPDDAHRLVGDVVSSLAGVTNWHLVADASSYFDQAGRPSLVRHLWSVAVEIQFYAACPFVVTWLWRRRRDLALPVVAAGVVGPAAVMGLLFSGDDPSRAYYGTDARVGALLAGVALALVLARRGEDRPDVDAAPGAAATGTRPGRAVLAPLGLVALAGLYLGADDQARWAYPGAFLATQAATVALIVAAVEAGPASRLLAHPALRWLGERSFGIYLWHWPAVALLRPGIDVGLPPAAAAATGLAAAVVLGALSYRMIERPLLRPRTGLPPPVRARRRAAGAAAALVALAGFAALVARVPTADPLADTLREGQRLLASQVAPAPAPSTAPTPAPTATAPAATAAITAPPATPPTAPAGR
ncbi:MAG TPA: acyltransferase [Acidimicrobiales bacterium]|nr:acyltransferase [Acidimicrobiales bacterium]